MTTTLLGTLTIGPMSPDEAHWVLDSFMRGSHWARSKIERAVKNGEVWVARADGDSLAYGWLCVLDEQVAHGYVKRDFRECGVMRALWETAGRPVKLLEPATRKGKALMRHLAGDT